jgi:hypothetical protein
MKPRKSKFLPSSRRDFAKALGFGIAAWTVASTARSRTEMEESELDTLAGLATDGCPGELSEAELSRLKKGIQEGHETASRIRQFTVEAEIGPAFVFWAR